MRSILNTIKPLIGIPVDYKQFDSVIITHINSVLMILNQLGVGPKEPVSITSDLDTWEDAFGDIANIEAIKTYIALKVQMYFDPPTGSVLEAKNRQIAELEWRLHIRTY
jgi:hypothetical protein